MVTKNEIQTVLVTGGTRGIGAAIAEKFRSTGADVIVTGTEQDGIDQINESSTERLTGVRAQFTEEASLQAFCSYISKLSRLDVCINNAGINIIKHASRVTAEDFDRLTAINYRAPFLIAQAAAEVMKRNGYGRIVNIGSIWSVVSKNGRSIYSASKSGIAGMTRALAIDYAADGIIVNCVSPGFVLTDLTRRSLSPEEIERLAAEVPLGRFAQPNEIANVVHFLASTENTYLTGQNIVVDGGFSSV